MSLVETGQMSAVETGQMSAVPESSGSAWAETVTPRLNAQLAAVICINGHDRT